jgi:hypothetical protein
VAEESDSAEPASDGTVMNHGQRIPASIALGVAALVGALFVFTRGLPAAVNLVHVSVATAIVLIVLGLLALAGGLLGVRRAGLIAGFGFLAAAVLQLAQLGRGPDLLGGDGSTMALLGGLGIGLVAVSFTRVGIEK